LGLWLEEQHMKCETIFSVNCNDEPAFVAKGGWDGAKSYLEFELLSKKKSIRAEWADEDILRLERHEVSEGFPATVTIDNKQTHKVVCRGGVFYEPGRTEMWYLQDEEGWSGFFPAIENVPPISGARDLSSFLNCVGGYASVGGGLGAAAGIAMPAPTTGSIGMAAGGAIGTAVGGLICGYQFYTAPPMLPLAPTITEYTPPPVQSLSFRGTENLDPFMPVALSSFRPKTIEPTNTTKTRDE
jgi:hypothetical protein